MRPSKENHPSQLTHRGLVWICIGEMHVHGRRCMCMCMVCMCMGEATHVLTNDACHKSKANKQITFNQQDIDELMKKPHETKTTTPHLLQINICKILRNPPSCIYLLNPYSSFTLVNNFPWVFSLRQLCCSLTVISLHLPTNKRLLAAT